MASCWPATKRTEADPPIRGPAGAALAGGEAELKRGDGDVANRTDRRHHAGDTEDNTRGGDLHDKGTFASRGKRLAQLPAQHADGTHERAGSKIRVV